MFFQSTFTNEEYMMQELKMIKKKKNLLIKFYHSDQ